MDPISDNSLSHPIDAVILWVDGNDPKHQEKMRPYLQNKGESNSNKFRTRFDQVNEIQYTVDSLRKFAPYIRNIFIITDDQTPEFISKDFSNTYSNVKLIDHKTIFTGFESYLPTFNSRSIETCMYRIPELAEHFIYLNDDFFIINPTKPTDFFQNGLPVLRGTWTPINDNKFNKNQSKSKVGHKTGQQLGAKVVGFNNYYRFKHTPHPIRRSTLQNYFASHKAVFEKNISFRFRNSQQFIPQGLANHLEIKNGNCHFENDLRLLYIRSYKKPLWWYKFKLLKRSKNKLFLGLQSLDQASKPKLNFILNWLRNRVA